MTNTIKERTLNTYKILHAIPEVALHEYKTAKYLAEQMKLLGYEVKENIANSTAFIGTLRGRKPGPVVGLRADMDALGHIVNGKKVAIHSCGHDAHCSMVLAVAEELAQEGISQGTLKIIFQPAEETLQGAILLSDSGELDDVEMLFGIHLRPFQEAETGKLTPALRHGASAMVRAIVHGKPAHGARPHLGINAINAAVVIIQSVNAIPINSMISSSIKATQIHGGGAVYNAIPESAEIVFDVRSADNSVMKTLLEKLEQAIQSGALAVGATAEMQIIGQVPAAKYDDAMIKLAKEAIVETLGESALLPEINTPGGEDFHFYAQRLAKVKTAYLGLGCNLTPGLHDPNMSFELDKMEYGAKVLATLVKKALCRVS